VIEMADEEHHGEHVGVAQRVVPEADTYSHSGYVYVDPPDSRTWTIFRRRSWPRSRRTRRDRRREVRHGVAMAPVTAAKSTTDGSSAGDAPELLPRAGAVSDAAS
jgi:hypothetical protein